MKKSYYISGMTCNGCKSHVTELLEKTEDVSQVAINLNEGIAEITAEKDISVGKFKQALANTHYDIYENYTDARSTFYVEGMSCQNCKETILNRLKEIDTIKDVKVNLEEKSVSFYSGKKISLSKLNNIMEGTHYTFYNNSEDASSDHNIKKPTTKHSNDSQFYCPMRCEGDKTYDKPGDCPVCGMDLVEEVNLSTSSETWTCPMHPEIEENNPGSCPKCGMELVPKKPSSEEGKNYQRLLNKFWIALGFTIPIFIISMSEMIPNNPLYDILPQYTWNWIQLILSIPVVFYATWMFFERAWRSIITWNLNMFTLIGIGAGVAWLFSVVGLLFPDIFPEQFRSMDGSVHVYIESATVILTLVLLGQVLEARAHSKTNSAIKKLIELSPNKAYLIINGEEKLVSIDKINKGDILRVKPGDKIPVDGSITEGESSIDESMITGEPIPVRKKAGDNVSSGTINKNNSFLMKAEKIGSETLLSQIISLVNEASRSRPPIQKLADTISSYFVPIVVLISIITFIVWSIFGPDPVYVFALINAIAVLIIACPCALGLATPMSIMVGIGKGAQAGILIKNAAALEKFNKIDTLIIDKTGTITEGKPSVEKIISLNNQFSETEITKIIASVNSSSEHPLAEATVKHAQKNDINLSDVGDFNNIPGKGVEGIIGETKFYLGNDKLMEHASTLINNKDTIEIASQYQEDGKTVSYLSNGDEVLGILVIGDKIKPTSITAIKELQDHGIRVIMLSGDNQKTASAVAKEVGISDFKGQMLPEDKINAVKEYQESGNIVAMAGDGINDAPALAQSDIGIAMGTGTDVAIESAEITLVSGDLSGIAHAYKLSAAVMRNIKENLIFALGYNTLGIPIAAGVLYPFFGLLLSPMIAALAMSFSSVSVITNALRLRTKKI